MLTFPSNGCFSTLCTVAMLPGPRALLPMTMCFFVATSLALGGEQNGQSQQATSAERDAPAESDTEDDVSTTNEQEPIRELELFEAMKQDLVGVLVVPRDFSILKMSLRNKTNRPLLIRAPEVFAAIPAQRVIAFESSGGNYPGTRYGAQSAQGLGGSFYQADSLAQTSRTRNDVSQPQEKDSLSQNRLPKWRLAPGRVVTQMVPCFCLEFGKPDPSPRIPYLLRPLTDLTNDSAVNKLLVQFSRQQIPQRVAQLAIWHVSSQVPWKLLAKAKLPRSIAGRNQSFQPQELQAARMIVGSLPEYQQRFGNPMHR